MHIRRLFYFRASFVHIRCPFRSHFSLAKLTSKPNLEREPKHEIKRTQIWLIFINDTDLSHFHMPSTLNLYCIEFLLVTSSFKNGSELLRGLSHFPFLGSGEELSDLILILIGPIRINEILLV